LPEAARGKVAFVQAFFFLKNQNNFPNGTRLQYGFAIDGTLVTLQGDALPKFTQTLTSGYLVGTYEGLTTGTNGIQLPWMFPVSVPSNASELQTVIQNSSLPLVTTQTGAVTTTTFTYTGSVITFTVPQDITAITLHLWGAGGGTQDNSNNPSTIPGVTGNPSRQGSGSGGYTTGTLAVSPGQLLYLVLGTVGSTLLIRGAAGTGFTGSGGGGFTAVFSQDPTGRTVAQALPTLLALAGGGGGAGINGGGVGGAGGGTTGGAGRTTGNVVQTAGATQTEGGGAGARQGALLAGGVSSGGGGGGGGYYGGGGASSSNQAGSGGSGFLGSLTSAATIQGTNATNYTTWAAPPELALMQSFFGANAYFGGAYQNGAAVIVTQGTYPTFIGSKLVCTY